MDTQTRIEAARAKLDRGRSQLLEAREAGPPCISCRHYIWESGLPRKGPFCGHPVYSAQAFNPVDGKVIATLAMSPDLARAKDGLCGLEAILYERHPVATGWDMAKAGARWGIGILALAGVLSILGIQ